MSNHRHTPGARRILVVANEIVEAKALRDAAGLRFAGPALAALTISAISPIGSLLCARVEADG